MLHVIIVIIGYLIGFIVGFSIVNIIKKQRLKRKKYYEQNYPEIFGYKNLKQEDTFYH